MNKQFIKGLIERKANGGYQVLASTASIDRQGDVIDQNGWELDNYKKNPVMLWAHDYSGLPVAKVNEIVVDSRGLVADYEFASADGNPMAQQIKELVDSGFINAVSVGFIPKERNGNIITRSELLEISFVPVPANQDALTLMAAKFDAELIAKMFTAEKDIDAEEEKEDEDESDEEDADESLDEEEKAVNTELQKIGAQHSSATKEKIQGAIDSMKQTVAVLEAMLAGNGSNDDEDGDEGKSNAPEVAGEDELRSLLTTRNLLRADNTSSFHALTAVNELIKQHASVAK